MKQTDQRPVFLNLLQIRLPLGGVLSILHRVSGVLLVLAIPIFVYFLQLLGGDEERVHILHRETLEVITMFGGGGRQPGLWFAPHSIATDSKGNIYTTETYEGKRIQKFIYQGIKDIPKMDQGVLWPAGELN